MFWVQRDRDKPRLALRQRLNITAGVREREDANRTREAGHRDKVEGVVASTLAVIASGAVSNCLGVKHNLAPV
jgi:hypothetical protein